MIVCAQDALKLSFGFDLSKEDLLRVPKQQTAPTDG
jgi:hypothetical protein